MLYPPFAASVVEDYGRGRSGPAYIRGASTCQAVLALQFEHSRDELAGAIHVTSVGVKGPLALALLGSSTMPAGYINLERTRGVWRVATLIGVPLP